MRMSSLLAVLTLGSTALGVRAGEVEVWAPNPLTAIYEGIDYAGRDDPKCAVRLAGARNGAFSGQVVVCYKEPGKGPEAKASDLKHEDGKGAIPAAAIEVRYALPGGHNGVKRLPKGQALFDGLAEKPREQGTVHPVWVTVNVPADAAAGEYEGRLSVAGREVPVKLTVAGWTLPEPKDYFTWADFIESPESVALHYKVPFWSDRHWELLGTAFDQLAKVGNKTVYIPLMAQTNFGNAESMVRWIKNGKEKEFKHDFTIAERYLDLYIERVGKPTVVILYLWEWRLGGSHGQTREEWERGTPVSLFDPKTRQVSVMEGPSHNNKSPGFPNYPDDTANFWKPVVDGMRERLKARGIGDEAIMLGMSQDMKPGKNTANYLKQIAPWARWAHQGHGLIGGFHGVSTGYVTTVWQAHFPTSKWYNEKRPLEKNRLYGWRKKAQVCCFMRWIWKPNYPTQLVYSRQLGEMNIAGKQRGFGRMSADFWGVLDSRWGLISIASRYPLSNWAQLNLCIKPYLHPGPEGAQGTIRFEMLREGVQECEARIFVERALLDEGKRAKLGEELAGRVQALLDDRVRAIFSVIEDYDKEQRFIGSGWQERSAGLYAAAVEVAKALGR